MNDTRILQKPNDKQFIITLPKEMVEARIWESGEVLKFVELTDGILIKRYN